MSRLTHLCISSGLAILVVVGLPMCKGKPDEQGATEGQLGGGAGVPEGYPAWVTPELYEAEESIHARVDGFWDELEHLDKRGVQRGVAEILRGWERLLELAPSHFRAEIGFCKVMFVADTIKDPDVRDDQLVEVMLDEWREYAESASDPEQEDLVLKYWDYTMVLTVAGAISAQRGNSKAIAFLVRTEAEGCCLLVRESAALGLAEWLYLTGDAKDATLPKRILNAARRASRSEHPRIRKDAKGLCYEMTELVPGATFPDTPTAKSLSGEPISALVASGKYTLVHATLPGCGACETLPRDVVDLRKEYPGLAQILIIVGDHRGKAEVEAERAGMDEAGVPVVVVGERDDLVGRLRLIFFPRFFLVGPDRRFAAVPRNLEEVREVLAKHCK